MQDKIKKLIQEALKNLGIKEVDFIVEHPEDLKNGDYSTNVAMVCAKNLKTNPKELAEKIVTTLRQAQGEFPEIQEIQVAGAGFINFYLPQKFFCGSVEEILNNQDFGKNKLFFGKKIMVEYTDPNPFKPFHIGHLMTNAIGESVARILEYSGAGVSRANYQGDIGLHVAKAIYGLLKNEKLQDKSVSIVLQSENIGKAYALGAEAYETDKKTTPEDGQAKEEIDEINKKIYSRKDNKINEIYDWGFKVTMEAFEDLYKMLGTKFDFYFLESMMAPIGEEIVRANVGKVFEESDGAIIFKGEKHDPKLHTRVFITSAGLPTYETKELGLTKEKFKTKLDMNLSIVVTAQEQMDYMKVVAKALSLIYPEYTDKMKHITHGMMKFASGKMSSRKGNIITGETLIRDTKMLVAEKMRGREMGEEEKEKVISDVAVAAIKYSILKQSIGGDIIYDFEKSISFEGDSGPYLQYSYARAQSVLRKAKAEKIKPSFKKVPNEISQLEKNMTYFRETVEKAGKEYEPHFIVLYLTELAREFNNYYAKNKIVDKADEFSPYKVVLAEAFSIIMKNGLWLLGIQAPEKM